MKGLSLIERYFKTCSYLLMAIGFTTLSLTGQVDLPSVLLYIIALVLSWRSDRPNSRLQISARTANWLAISFIPLTYFDWRYVSSSYTGPLIHYALFISIFNLFKVKADRDWVFLYLIAIFEVLLAATLTIDFLFIVMLSIFVLVTLATLEAFEIRRSHREVYEPREERLLNRLGRVLPIRRIIYLVGVTFVMVILIGLIATPIFLLIPRFNSGFMAQSFGATMVSITGFSDIVELGQVGNIKKNEQVVMHVRLKPVNREMKILPKWRGVALSQYNGKSWREPPGEPRKVVRAINNQYQLEQRSVEEAQIVEQIFYLEPLNTPVVFIANRPLSISDQLTTLYRAQLSGTLTTADHSYKQISYTAYSDLARPSDVQLRNDEKSYDDETKDRYLQLPTLDPRIAELARKITANSNTRFDKAITIEQYLRSNYGYTLEQRRTNEPDPLADFLFNIRAGHCEYFASAMVIMLRSVGVAARIVNGFQTGEYNEVGNVYMVRQSDAHSWVEVYFPENDRWVEFDPTPAAGFSQYQSGLVTTLKKYVGALRILWLDYVVTYDSQRQSYLAVSIQRALFRYKLKIDQYQVSLRQYLLALYAQMATGKTFTQHSGNWIALFMLMLMLIGFWRVRHLIKQWRLAPTNVFSSWLGRLLVLPWLRWRARTNPQQSAVIFYNEMLALLAHWGIFKLPNQTPLEFAQEKNLAEVRLITDYYNLVRYRGSELGEEQREEVAEVLSKLRKRRPGIKEVKLPLLNRRRLALIAMLISLPVTILVVLYYYNEHRLGKEATIASIHLSRFKPENVSELLNNTVVAVRSESGDSDTELLTASSRKFAEQSQYLAINNQTPWEENFEPATAPLRDHLESLFARPEIDLWEQAAARREFRLSGYLDLSQQQRQTAEQLSYRLGMSVTTILLWKAHILLRDGKNDDCERELALVISLGDHLRQDYSFINMLLGYTVMARGAIALGKYHQMFEKPEQAKDWFEFSKICYRRRAEMYHLYQQIHIVGVSETHLETLFELAHSSEPAVAQEAVAAIGSGWLFNPNQVLLGLSGSRRALLEDLAHSSNIKVAKMAAHHLIESTGMSLTERTRHFIERYQVDLRQK
ncbi:MAG: DUF3488 and transglutaminase-like domain-containing protein [Acidobacteriota bacterium]